MRRVIGLALGIVLAMVGAALAEGPAMKKSVDDFRDGDKPLPVVTPIFNQVVSYTFPKGFVPAFQKAQGDFYIQESVLKGETVDKWTQMITLTGNQGLSATPNLTPKKYAEHMVARFQKGCPDSFTASGLAETMLSGHKAYIVHIGCGTAGPGASHSEAMLMVVVQGAKDYYTIQWAERGKATKTLAYDDGVWSKRLKALMPIRVCTPAPGEKPPYADCLKVR